MFRQLISENSLLLQKKIVLLLEHLWDNQYKNNLDFFTLMKKKTSYNPYLNSF